MTFLLLCLYYFCNFVINCKKGGVMQNYIQASEEGMILICALAAIFFIFFISTLISYISLYFKYRKISKRIFQKNILEKVSVKGRTKLYVKTVMVFQDGRFKDILPEYHNIQCLDEKKEYLDAEYSVSSQKWFSKIKGRNIRPFFFFIKNKDIIYNDFTKK